MFGTRRGIVVCLIYGCLQALQDTYDVDADGGRLVTVDDLARSPLFEVVQLYGLDPRQWIC